MKTHKQPMPGGLRPALPAGITLILAALLATLPGCAQLMSHLPKSQAVAAEPTSEPEAAPEPEPIPAAQETEKPGQLYDWNGDGRSVTRIVIDTNEQKARFYDGSEQIGWTTVATGVSGHPTPTGEFEVLEKIADKRSNLYGRIYNSGGAVVKRDAKIGRDSVPPGGRFVGASMPNFMRITYDGIGLHAGPIPRPGRPASHGCIRLPRQFASAVYKHVPHGTPVTVVGSGPSYGNYAERVRVEQAEAEARRVAAAAATDVATLGGGTDAAGDIGSRPGATASPGVSPVATTGPAPGPIAPTDAEASPSAAPAPDADAQAAISQPLEVPAPGGAPGGEPAQTPSLTPVEPDPGPMPAEEEEDSSYYYGPPVPPSYPPSVPPLHYVPPAPPPDLRSANARHASAIAG